MKKRIDSALSTLLCTVMQHEQHLKKIWLASLFVVCDGEELANGWY